MTKEDVMAAVRANHDLRGYLIVMLESIPPEKREAFSALFWATTALAYYAGAVALAREIEK